MTRRRLLAAIGAVFLVSVLTQSIDPGVRAGASLLPDRLSSQEFWSLSSELSEADGFFRSDNLLSNELRFSTSSRICAHGQARRRLPRASAGAELHLHRRAQAGDGVHRRHPARQSAAASDVQSDLRDVGRSCRVRVASVLAQASGRARPQSTAQDIFAAFTKIDPDDALYKTNLKTIQDHLVKTDGLPLSEEDLKGIDYVYRSSTGTDRSSSTGRLEAAAAGARRHIPI